jgi:hypothetical protein
MEELSCSNWLSAMWLQEGDIARRTTGLPVRLLGKKIDQQESSSRLFT